MVFVKDYVEELFSSGKSGNEIANDMSISVSMVSSYRRQHYNPSLTVAKTVYEQTKVVLHPFSEESLQFELSKRK